MNISTDERNSDLWPNSYSTGPGQHHPRRRRANNNFGDSSICPPTGRNGWSSSLPSIPNKNPLLSLSLDKSNGEGLRALLADHEGLLRERRLPSPILPILPTGGPFNCYSSGVTSPSWSSTCRGRPASSSRRPDELRWSGAARHRSGSEPPSRSVL